MSYAIPSWDLPSIPINESEDRFPVRRIYCIGRNYAAHAREMGADEREPPFFFLKHADALVQNGATIPYPPATQNLHYEAELVAAIGKSGSNIPVESEWLRRQEAVGPKIGEELKSDAISAIFVSIVLIIIYVWFRFKRIQYGIAAVVALVHDVLITLGVFSLFDLEISLAIVASLLTIVGYSLNDTIVVFDRVREDLRLYRRETFGQILNRSINECLNRTVLTSGTTLFVVTSLLTLGGEVIHDFALALLVGVIIGTYSSSFVASPVVYFWLGRGEKEPTSAQTGAQNAA